MATLGKTAVGGSNANSSADYVHAFGPFTATENGTATAVNFYGTAATFQLTLGVYADSAGLPGARLAVSSEITWQSSAGWNTAAVSASLVSGSAYWVVLNSNREFTYYYDAGASGALQYKSSAYSAGSLPDPFGTPDGNLARECSAYITYTASSSGNPWYAYAQQLRSAGDKMRQLISIPSFAEVMKYNKMVA